MVDSLLNLEKLDAAESSARRVMSFLHTFRKAVNGALEPCGLRLDTLTADNIELDRLRHLDSARQFRDPALPLLPQFAACDHKTVLASIAARRGETERFRESRSPSQYSFHNDYWASRDAEPAWAIVCDLRPTRIVEIGSGNSTRLFREAIDTQGLGTELVSIDPNPRVDIQRAATRIIKRNVESLPEKEIAALIGPGDFLFIDSSHDVRAGNDCVHLFLKVVPLLPAGAVIHVHDIFLPYEYPREWMIDFQWWQFREQYLVQAMLQESDRYRVLWAGHYAQRTIPGFEDYFAGPMSRAASLWMRKER